MKNFTLKCCLGNREKEREFETLIQNSEKKDTMN